MILAIKRSIEVANKSYSATRYHRRIEYIERIDEDRIHIQMTSPESINPVRCITNLSRAFLKDAYAEYVIFFLCVFRNVKTAWGKGIF